jgi:hypothetical protein
MTIFSSKHAKLLLKDGTLRVVTSNTEVAVKTYSEALTIYAHYAAKGERWT